jgi:hypothetical protein
MRRLPRLRVRVNAELVLDAGSQERVATRDGAEWLLRPPEVSMFHQVVAYLRAKPEPTRNAGSNIAREGVAAAAVALRWGSYLAVLLDGQKPVWEAAEDSETSRISDEEMARINIEASAALAEWVDIFRANPCGGQYAAFVDKAVAYLPMPRRAARRTTGPFEALGSAGVASQLVTAMTASAREHVDRARANAERHPSRVFANALVNVAWRNGPVEDIHAGRFRGYPIDERRITPAEERTLMRFTIDRMAMGMWTCFGLCTEQPPRSWSEQALPYGLAGALLLTPSQWTLTEASRDVRLPVAQPKA